MHVFLTLRNCTYICSSHKICCFQVCIKMPRNSSKDVSTMEVNKYWLYDTPNIYAGIQHRFYQVCLSFINETKLFKHESTFGKPWTLETPDGRTHIITSALQQLVLMDTNLQTSVAAFYSDMKVFCGFINKKNIWCHCRECIFGFLMKSLMATK